MLTGTFMVRQLQPRHENLKKRQVKAQKIYIRDSGILHALLGLESMEDVLAHPKAGASWEGFAIEELLLHAQSFFWATPGENDYPVDDSVSVIPLSAVPAVLLQAS